MTGNSTKVLKVSALTQLCSIILLPFSAAFGILGISFVRFFEWGARNITLAYICFYTYKLNTSIIGLLKNMKKPDFIFIGTGKSGTTWLFKNLQSTVIYTFQKQGNQFF